MLGRSVVVVGKLICAEPFALVQPLIASNACPVCQIAARQGLDHL
jgi:hypothetical protein